MRHAAWLFGMVLLVACGGGGGDDDDDSGGGVVEGTLEISPPGAELFVNNGVAASQVFSATLHRPDGTTEDVTASTAFTVDRSGLGSFSAETFTAYGAAGGKGVVTASYRGVTAEAVVVVHVSDVRVVSPAPADAADLFDDAAPDAALAPTIVYPSDDTIVPPNLGDFEVHWTDAVGADLFELSVTSEYANVTLYVTGTPNGGTFAALEPREWSILGLSLRGATATVTVRGMVSSSPGAAGASTPISVHLTEQEIQGGIYYWAATSSAGEEAEGIYRHDMSRPGEPAEPFYTRAQSSGGRCVACHVLSRDGERMAVTFEGGDGPATVLDVATRTSMIADDGTFAWNFATFEPGGGRLLAVSQGVLTLRDPTTGAVITTVPTPGYASHPDFAPDGSAITYVSVASPGEDWHFTGGTIVTQSFDAATATFGAAETLVTGAENAYYPSWSPDSQWILFNRSNEDAYDDATAEMWVVKADGSQPPLKLDSPNVGAGLTNSWARWAPFEQTLGAGSASPEPFFWLTFSSKRAFGVRLPQGTPQIWMTPFFPERAAAGHDPSGPAFRLPFQNIGSTNHIAQWTERVVPVE